MKNNIVMLVVLSLLAVICAGDAHSAPYFRFRPFRTVSAGAFVPIAGGTDDVRAGLLTPVLSHDSADGYLLIPGVNWHLLTLGVVLPDGGRPASVTAGPAIDLSEPIKSLLRKGIDRLPSADGNYGGLRSLLRADADLTANVGPSLAVSLSDGRMQLLLAAGLNKRF